MAIRLLSEPDTTSKFVGEAERRTGVYTQVHEDVSTTKAAVVVGLCEKSIGILALQGSYSAHANMLNKLSVPWQYIRKPEELSGIKGLILPGGESTTMLKLLDEAGLFTAIQAAEKNGMPIFGTCAGAILLAKKVHSPAQSSFEMMDIEIERNAYGRQLASHVVMGESSIDNHPMEMVFIRAPRFTNLSPQVKIIATYEKEPVCVQKGHLLAASFHPELTNDTTLHEYFVRELCGC